MAKTFDNISEASGTNYLFLFTQRALALQHEPPTPPPLYALSLPSKAVWAMDELWKACKATWRSRKRSRAPLTSPPSSPPPEPTEEVETVVVVPASATTEAEPSDPVDGHLPATQPPTAVEDDGAAEVHPRGSDSAIGKSSIAIPTEPSNSSDRQETTPVRLLSAAEGRIRRWRAAGMVVRLAALRGRGQAAVTERTHAEKMAPLAALTAKISEYIIDHQDDAAHEERWRTMMKRNTAKSFREQRELMKKVEARVEEVQRELHAKLEQILDRLGTPRP